MTRVVSGVVMIAIAIAVVWFAPPLLFLIVAQLLVVLGVAEYVGLSKTSGHLVPMPLIAAAAVATSVALARGGPGSPLVVLALLATLVGLGSWALFTWDGGPQALAGISAAIFPTIYLGLPIGALVVIRDRQGAAGLFLLMLTVMISDTAQYYSGRTFGKRALAPTISPKKTIEGAIGGFVFGPLAFAFIGIQWLPQPALSLPVRLGLGLLLVIVGIAGDLFESMLKRSAGVKDSSHLIPGHGGVLDRIDALLFTAPVYFLALTYL